MAKILNSKLGRFTKVSKDTTLVNSILGDYSYIGGNSKVNNATIGKFCSIASGVLISTGMHSTEFVSTHPIFYSIKKQCGKTFISNQKYKEFEEVRIGNDVWIGTNSIILDGVIIGDGAIIAANSVVNKDVEAYSIVGGLPARQIKYRFDQQTIELLESFKWWDKSEEWIQKHAEDMIDIMKFKDIVMEEVHTNGKSI